MDYYILYFVILAANFTVNKAINWLPATDQNVLIAEKFENNDFGLHSNKNDLISQLTKDLHSVKTNNSIMHTVMPEYSPITVINTPYGTETYQSIEKMSNVKLSEANNVSFTNYTPITERGFLPSQQYAIPEHDIIIRKAKATRKHLLKSNHKNESNNHQSKFLEVFEVVEFDHEICTSSSGLEGTCVHEYDCQSVGGSHMGSCADGLGTCCVILFSCDSRSAAPIGWFTNPHFPSPSSERLSCTITLDKISDDIKQLRLDLTNFEILPPTNGNCEQDQFSVSGQDENNIIPILCGINTGQHVYIEVGNIDGPINISIQTLSEENRLFSIKVTQMTAADNLAAPTGCLQYYKEEHGHIESFNYRDRSEIGITRTLGYLNNLNYAICIARSPAACTITYTNVGEMQIVNYDIDGAPLIPPRQAGVEIYNCPSDWLLLAAVRLCGERLNDGAFLQDFSLDAPVTDDGAGPITVWFRTDGVYTGRGFKLHYQQNSCSNFK